MDVREDRHHFVGSNHSSYKKLPNKAATASTIERNENKLRRIISDLFSVDGTGNNDADNSLWSLYWFITIRSLVGFNTRTGIKLLTCETTAFPMMMLSFVYSLLGSTTHIVLSLFSWVAVAHTIASEFAGIFCCGCTTTCNTSAFLSYPTEWQSYDSVL
uniref:Uncharacterized protein n=1 Tax=Glossina austeni TaxID=7395 RepID=A0A1A9V0Z6_GLOAU